jgi:hypothetical protein
MHRRGVLLAVLAAAKGKPFGPAQIQKAIFLIDKNLPSIFDQNSRFDFLPYNYGPFDRDVYVEVERLRDAGEAVIAPSPGGRWRTYAASDMGQKKGQEILTSMKVDSRRYVESIADWVLAQSFGSLVKSIYDAYPEMKQNSIFQS